jgi:hypothetical protein
MQPRTISVTNDHPRGYRRRARRVPPGTWTRERVLAALQEWTAANGRPPRAEDWSTLAETKQRAEPACRWLPESPSWPCPTTVRRYFGSWSAALEAAGLRSHRLAPWELNLAERVESARRLASAGRATSEIARQLDISASTVRKYLQARSCPGCSGPLVTPNARLCHPCATRSRPPDATLERAVAARRAWSDDRAAIVAALKTLAAENGRRPTISDLQPKRPNLPSYSKTVAVFGSFSAAVEAAGFQPRGRDWSSEQVIDALKHWSREHGRPPTCSDWRHTSHDHPGSRAVADLFGSWQTALIAAGLRRPWEPAAIQKALRRWAKEHGRPPTSRDWQSPDTTDRRPTTEHVRHACGSWAAALSSAGLAPARRRWTKEQALTALRAWTLAYGRTPHRNDWRYAALEHPQAATVVQLFGSWEQALVAAALVPSGRTRVAA